MTDFKPIKFDEENLRKYWDGSSNRFARYYTYLQRGLGLFNETKNYLMLAFGSYWTIKTMTIMGYTLTSGWTLAIVITGAGIGIPILLLMGRWDMFKLSKSREFASTQHGTVTQYNSYNMNVRQIEQNDEIIALLKELNTKYTSIHINNGI